MDTIKIGTGEKRIAIDDDPERVIVFNPKDVLFAERFYKMLAEFQDKLEEFKIKAQKLEQVDPDSDIPSNADERIALIKDACIFMRGRIDYLFGDGTSQTAFGDALDLDAIKQFFEGITSFVQTARAEKVQKYTNSKKRK